MRNHLFCIVLLRATFITCTLEWCDRVPRIWVYIMWCVQVYGRRDLSTKFIVVHWLDIPKYVGVSVSRPNETNYRLYCHRCERIWDNNRNNEYYIAICENSTENIILEELSLKIYFFFFFNFLTKLVWNTSQHSSIVPRQELGKAENFSSSSSI